MRNYLDFEELTIVVKVRIETLVVRIAKTKVVAIIQADEGEIGIVQGGVPQEKGSQIIFMISLSLVVLDADVCFEGVKIVTVHLPKEVIQRIDL